MLRLQLRQLCVCVCFVDFFLFLLTDFFFCFLSFFIWCTPSLWYRQRSLQFDNREDHIKKLWSKKTAPGVELSAEEKKEKELLGKAAKMAAARLEEEKEEEQEERSSDGPEEGEEGEEGEEEGALD